MNRWPTAPIADFCTTGSGGTPSREKAARYYDGGTIPWVKSGELRESTITSTEELITEAALKETSVKMVPSGALLLAMYGATVGRLGVLGVAAATNQAVCHIVPDPRVAEVPYLFRVLSNETANIVARGVGGAQPNISQGIIKGLVVPLPPLAEQRRIADILDKTDALRAQRRAALAELDALAHASFTELFTLGLDGPAVDLSASRSGVPEGWSWALLTDVARLATGHTPDRDREDYWNGDIPWISLTDIRDLDGTVATQTIQNVSALGIDNSSSVLLPKGTVCFSRTASVGFVTVMGRKMATSQDFVNWVCGPKLDPTYLMWALLGARQRLRSLSSGSTHKTIYMRVVEEFYVLVPPMALQQAFGHRIAAIEFLKSRHGVALSELDTLFASLQHRAFRGEL